MKWPSAKLAEVCTKIGSGATPRGGDESYKSSGIALVRSMNVHQARFKHEGLAFIDAEQATLLDNVTLQDLDVLINITGASVARCCLLDKSVLPARVNQHVCILRSAQDKVIPAYLMRFLTSRDSQRELNKIAESGATRQAITKGELSDFEIPLPPLAEQKRIAGILDAADALRAKRREALAQLDTLLHATFLDLFGDPVTNPKGWEVRTLEESGAKTKVGPFGSLLHTYDYIVGGVPLVNPKHMVDGKIVHLGDETVSEEKASELQDYRLKIGDLLVARRGEMGRCVIVHEEHSGWLCGTGSFYIRTNPKVMLTEFLAACISSQPMRKFLEHLSGGAIMPSLSGTQIKNLMITIPPVEVQSRFVRASQAIAEQQKQQSKHLAELDTLFASLQSRAFRGEL